MTTLLILTNLLTIIYAAAKIKLLEKTVGKLIVECINLGKHIKQIEECFVGEE